MSFRVNVPVRFGDIDALGHVNNAVFLTYCEVARQNYCRRELDISGASDFPFILARAELDFLQPVALEVGSVELSLSVPRIGNSSWDFAYEISAEGKVCARALTVQVYYDYKSARATPLPSRWRTKLKQLLVEAAPQTHN